MVHILVGHKVRHDIGSLLNVHQDIEVTDGFFAAPVTAGHCDLFEAWVLFEIIDIAAGEFLSHHPLGAGFAPVAALDFFQDRGLGLGAKSIEFANFLFLGGFFQRRKVSDIQRFIQGLDLFGSQPRDAQQVMQARRQVFFQFP